MVCTSWLVCLLVFRSLLQAFQKETGIFCTVQCPPMLCWVDNILITVHLCNWAELQLTEKAWVWTQWGQTLCHEAIDGLQPDSNASCSSATVQVWCGINAMKYQQGNAARCLDIQCKQAESEHSAKTKFNISQIEALPLKITAVEKLIVLHTS